MPANTEINVTQVHNHVYNILLNSPEGGNRPMFEIFAKWSEERIADCEALQAELTRDGRQDEAAFMQIRKNVYNIFLTAGRALKGDMAALKVRLERIPEPWEKSLAAAQAHDDIQKAHIEKIKLETVASIRHYFSSLEAANHD